MSCSAILLPLTAALLAAQQSSAPADLDATVARVMAEQHVVGASVLVAKDGRVLLHHGYGLADLGLDVATKDETVYHIVGPMLPFTGVAVMQLVERGKLALDDDISKYVPEFPMQGRRVTHPPAARSHVGNRRLPLPRRPDRGDEPAAQGARRGDGAVRRQDVGERARRQMGLVDLRLSAARHDHRARVGAVVRRLRADSISSRRPASSTRRYCDDYCS